MNTPNTRLAVVTLAIAATSIGAGAVVSGNAIAGADVKDGSGDRATVSVVSAGANGGDPIQCSFDDVDLAVPVIEGEAPMATTGSAGPVDAAGDGGTGGFIVAVAVADGTAIPTGAPGFGVVPSSSAGSDEPLPPGAEVVPAESARNGSATECAELRKTLSPER